MTSFLRYVWAAPNTALGLTLLPLALANGRARLVHGVLELHSPLIAVLLRRLAPTPGGAAALTLGHVVLGQDEAALDATRCHEREHVGQYERWGPAFIPAYALASLWAWLHGNSAYYGNHFEQQAYRRELRNEDERQVTWRLPTSD